MALHRFRVLALSLILRSPTSFPSSQAPSLFSLGRLLCSAATTESPVSSPSSFAAEDYLVSRCGLTRAQAVKASKRISHLTSRSQPDAVLAFLSGILGVPSANITALITLDPSFLCSNLERTVKPRITKLSELGLSREEIASLIPLSPKSIRSRFLGRNIEFWLKQLGSFDKLLQAVRMNSNLLTSDTDKVIAPNLTLLRQCGLNVSGMVAANIYSTRLFTKNPKLLQEAVERTEELGVKRGARMFGRALVVISLTTKVAATRRIQLLRKFGFSQDVVLEIIRRAPALLAMSDQKIQGNMDFLMKDVGLDLSYIGRRPTLLMYSVEHRLFPRHCLLKVLREKGLLNTKMGYYKTVSLSEKTFLQKFVLAYEDNVPGLVDYYASKCSGKAADKVALQQK
ncbi:hypothetical protein PR202_ga16996 [Eleusine coracana subsp. coracana]|uniref:Uncharacterized protein n=1 Tax=Eleusine coracana subsp. coracana TaxID=191504 RepID=A0AAV5CNB1_ELECO|nr:hypothetical protein QOZ80_6AG0519700 [Eleusine coracana subsp. coracana]GJM99858.1 hypothetical protein PR202_ga16996 [Eleusine coracana subsp. coracana]